MFSALQPSLSYCLAQSSLPCLDVQRQAHYPSLLSGAAIDGLTHCLEVGTGWDCRPGGFLDRLLGAPDSPLTFGPEIGSEMDLKMQFSQNSLKQQGKRSGGLIITNGYLSILKLLKKGCHPL